MVAACLNSPGMAAFPEGVGEVGGQDTRALGSAVADTLLVVCIRPECCSL